jgi:tetratricopeptide (TPR) repeat protein
MSRLSPKKKNLTPAEPAVVAEIRREPAALESVLLRALLILAVGLFVYAPVFHGGWLWDDDQEITANAVLREPGGLARIWAGDTGADYFPLKSTVQWLAFRVIADNNTGWHLLNISLHLLNTLLVWVLLARLGVRQGWLGGLLFCVHPILVSSVAWVSELKNTLSLPFVIFSLLAWIAFEERGRLGHYLLAVLFFIAATLTKTSVVMIPFVLLLYAWWRAQRGHPGGANCAWPWLRTLADKLQAILPLGIWRTAVASIPFFLVSLAFGLLTIKFQHARAIGSEEIPVGDLFSRTETAGLAVWFYFFKTLFPVGLLPIYPRWTPQPWMLAGWPLLAGMLFWLWSKRRTWGAPALLGIGFFFINLVPVLGFITMSYMRITWVSDHFLYLPALGLIGLVAAAAGAWYDAARRERQKALAVAGTVLLAVLAVGSHRYAGVFANEYEMWTYTLRRNPDAWQAHSRLGKVLLERGENDRAFHHISESVRLRPDLAETHNNYGAMLEKKGDMNGAVHHLRTATQLSPDIPIYKINLGSLLVRVGRNDEAVAVYENLLTMQPDNPTYLCNLGVAQFFLGRNDEAIANFQKALQINPDLRDARENLAQALKRREGGTAPAATPAPAAPPANSGLLDTGTAIKLFGN